MKPTNQEDWQFLYPNNNRAIVPCEIKKVQFHITSRVDRIDIIFSSTEEIKDTFKAINLIFHGLDVGIKYTDSPFIHLELDKLGTIMWKKFINNYVFYDKTIGFYCTYFKIDKTGCLIFNPERINESGLSVQERSKQFLVQLEGTQEKKRKLESSVFAIDQNQPLSSI